MCLQFGSMQHSTASSTCVQRLTMGNETTVIPASLTVASVLANASGFWTASELQSGQRPH